MQPELERVSHRCPERPSADPSDRSQMRKLRLHAQEVPKDAGAPPLARSPSADGVGIKLQGAQACALQHGRPESIKSIRFRRTGGTIADEADMPDHLPGPRPKRPADGSREFGHGLEAESILRPEDMCSFRVELTAHN